MGDERRCVGSACLARCARSQYSAHRQWGDGDAVKGVMGWTGGAAERALPGRRQGEDLDGEVGPSVQKNVGRHLDRCGRTMGVR